MDTIVINGREFNKVDLQNGFTFSANRIAKKILKDVISKIPTEANENEALQNINMLNSIIECDNETDIMGLIYINNEEKYFNESTYKDRVKFFENAIMTEEVENDIRNFFTFKTALIAKNSLTYLVEALGTKQTLTSSNQTDIS